jgi:hypothetical protein
MPRFFFDFDDGSMIVRDDEGTDLPDVAAARREAYEMVAQVAADSVPGETPVSLHVVVRDDCGKPCSGRRWTSP